VGAAGDNGKGAAEFPDRSLSAIGGVETGEDAAQFILLGANSVQVCTGVMIHGYKLVHTLKEGLSRFMDKHKFSTIEQFRGHALQFFTTHADLVHRQAEAKAAERAAAKGHGHEGCGLERRQVVEQSQKLVSNT
jgi:glutamate synthase domain-containing protein 2